jgi:hypothetical protein
MGVTMAGYLAINAPGFTGFAYNERADRRSWPSMLDLFHDRLDPI